MSKNSKEGYQKKLNCKSETNAGSLYCVLLEVTVKKNPISRKLLKVFETYLIITLQQLGLIKKSTKNGT